MNKFNFGTHLNLPAQAIDISGGAAAFTSTIAVQMCEAVEEAILDEIAKAATEQGIADVYVLNKRSILDALKKQIPTKPEFWGDGYANGAIALDYAKCPNCGNDNFEYEIGNWGCKHCPECGQALDWSDVE